MLTSLQHISITQSILVEVSLDMAFKVCLSKASRKLCVTDRTDSQAFFLGFLLK